MNVIDAVFCEVILLANVKNTIWHNKSYLYFWLVQSISNLGSAITTLVLPLMILKMTKSPLQVSVVSALQVAPYAILGLPAGVYLDKWDRKKVM
ncbi:UNVERIFIED_ORG: MFS family permease [Heyndrickxia coagulans]